MKLTVMTPTSKTSTMEVSDAIFGQKANPALLAQAIRVYLSNLRQGTSKVKTRAQVNRTKAKWYRQKGTGNARHGARSAPIFVGGGVAHGPTGKQNWEKALSRKMKAQALRVALSLQVEKIIVTDNLNGLKGKTSEAAAILQKMLGKMKRTLIVLGENPDLMYRSVRNIDSVLPISVDQLTALQVALADRIIFTKQSLQALETRLAVKKRTIKVIEPAKKAVPKKTAKKTVAKKVPAKKVTKKKK